VRKPKDLTEFVGLMAEVRKAKQKAASLLFEEIEHETREQDGFVMEQLNRMKEMHENYETLTDFHTVLTRIQKIVPAISLRRLSQRAASVASEDGRPMTSLNYVQEQDDKVPLMSSGLQFANIAGAILQTEKEKMKKLMFRATRGNALTFFSDFTETGFNGHQIHKTVYLVVFQEGVRMRERVTRICDSFMGQRFELPPHDGIP